MLKTSPLALLSLLRRGASPSDSRGESSRSACSAATASANSSGRPRGRHRGPRKKPAARSCRNPRRSVRRRARRGPRLPLRRRGRKNARSRPGPGWRRRRERYAVEATHSGAAPKARPHASANPLLIMFCPTYLHRTRHRCSSLVSALGKLWEYNARRLTQVTMMAWR